MPGPGDSVDWSVTGQGKCLGYGLGWSHNEGGEVWGLGGAQEAIGSMFISPPSLQVRIKRISTIIDIFSL